MYLSQPLQDLPKEPSSLCMFLRKHIEGSRIVKVEQINGDRIMCIQTDKLEWMVLLRVHIFILN